jgi:aarF domain-containing kinase
MLTPSSGNVIIRPHPARPSQPQLVLLDHGLYVRLSDEFRQQYAVLWKALLTADQDTIVSVTSAWGFGAPDIFASATLLRPVQFGKKKHLPNSAQEATPAPERQLSNYEIGVRMKEKLRSFLTDTDKMPKELVFIGRNMRIVQGNNQGLGSPVNRIKVMGTWASGALVATPGLSVTERIREYFLYFRFRTALLVLDAAFWGSHLRGWIRERLGLKREGFEDELERKMRGIAKSNFGMDISPDAFNG